MSLTVVGSVAFVGLENLKYKSKYSLVITKIMINLKTLFSLLIVSFILVNCSEAQKNSSPESHTKISESSDGINPTTKRFESNLGNFSINISQTPLQTRTIDAEKGKEPGKQFLWQFERTVYTVMYSEFNKSDYPRPFDDMNSGVRKTLLRNGSQIISENEISFKEYPAREFRYIAPNGVKQIGRNYLVNNMGYLLTAGFVDEKSEKEAIEVLDSFKLLDEKN